ncbi:MAG: L-serine ammonia-lyase, iron-sulfur-dependent, subunit alpha, partial [Anaerolineae bacterium]|nr:L-serine ammonia-lyase, iron-sulfur-dependent, subunit alpha [Anaerolineae bacterium]
MFDSIAQLVAEAGVTGHSLHEVIIEAEMANSGKPRDHLMSRMGKRLEIMQRAAAQGISEPVMSISGISGGSAYRFWNWLDAGHEPLTGPILSRAVARAMAVNEVNAGMGC